jgi:DNA-binding transcriptional LysR family regulator
VAGLEAVAGRPLFERRRDGVTLTAAGARLLARAVRVLEELDAAAREVAAPTAGAGPVRLGAFSSAVAGLVPRVLAALPQDLVVTVREGSTPALTRALRAGTIDLAVIAQVPPFRPPDAESPRLAMSTLSEGELVIGVGAGHPFAGRRAVEVAELSGQTWVGVRPDEGETQLGVWPGLAERPDLRYAVRDWHAKLQIVAAGLAVTTLAPVALHTLPAGIRVVAVRGEPAERRRLVLAHLPTGLTAAARVVAHALQDVVRA